MKSWRKIENTLGECGINSLGLHSLYWHGGLDAHLNWLLDEDTQSLIEDCEKRFYSGASAFMRSIGLLPSLLSFAKPEWFRMNEEGIRTNDWNFLCFKRRSARLISNSAYKLALLLRQSSHEYYIWMDDKKTALPLSQMSGYSGADQNMIVMKAILKGLKRYDSKAKLLPVLCRFPRYRRLRPIQHMFLSLRPSAETMRFPWTGTTRHVHKNRKVLKAC